MLDVNETSTCTFHFRWNELVACQGLQNDSVSKDRLKQPTTPFLKVDFEDSHF